MTTLDRPKPVIERYENRTFNFGKQLRARRTALEWASRFRPVRCIEGWPTERAGRVTRACAEKRGSHVHPRRTSRIHSPKHAYRCRSRDAPRNRVRQVGWRDAAHQSRQRADTAE